MKQCLNGQPAPSAPEKGVSLGTMLFSSSMVSCSCSASTIAWHLLICSGSFAPCWHLCQISVEHDCLLTLSFLIQVYHPDVELKLHDLIEVTGILVLDTDTGAPELQSMDGLFYSANLATCDPPVRLVRQMDQGINASQCPFWMDCRSNNMFPLLSCDFLKGC